MMEDCELQRRLREALSQRGVRLTGNVSRRHVSQPKANISSNAFLLIEQVHRASGSAGSKPLMAFLCE